MDAHTTAAPQSSSPSLRRQSAAPVVAAALGFGVGVNAAVASVVAAVLAASRSEALDSLTTASLRPASDAGLSVATGLAVALVAALAVFAGSCLAAGRLPKGGRLCRIAVPGSLGAATGLIIGAWALGRVVGFGGGGSAHAPGLVGWLPAAIVGAALAVGMIWRRAAIGVRRAGVRLGDALRKRREAATAWPRARYAAAVTLSVGLLAACGLVLGRTTGPAASGMAGASPRTLDRPAECPGRSPTAPGAGCRSGTAGCTTAAEPRQTPTS